MWALPLAIAAVTAEVQVTELGVTVAFRAVVTVTAGTADVQATADGVTVALVAPEISSPGVNAPGMARPGMADTSATFAATDRVRTWVAV